MNRNGNETESFGGNFVAPDDCGLFFEVPLYFDPTIRERSLKAARIIVKI
jgi:hypothetical protein